jgi:hypothetical protein
MQIFLKASQVYVEAEDFGREGVLPDQFVCALDAALPRGSGHRVIIDESVDGGKTEEYSAERRDDPREIFRSAGKTASLRMTPTSKMTLPSS